MDESGDHLGRVARGTAGNAAGAVLSQAGELAAFAVALDRVGSVAFAVIVLGQSLAQWPYLLESGIGQVVNRLLAGRRRDEWFQDQASAAVVVYAGLGLVTLVGGLIVSHFLLVPVFGIPSAIGDKATLAFDYIVLGATVKMALGFVPRSLVGQTRLGAARVVEIVRAAVALVGTVTLVGSGPSGLPAAGFALMLGDLAASIVGLVVLRPRRALRLSSKRPSRSAFGDHWRSSKPLLLASALSLGWTKTDAVIVGVGLGPVALTTYGVIVRAYEGLTSGVQLLTLGLVPSAARYLDIGDRVGLGRIYRRAVAYIAVTMWPAAAAIAVFTTPVVNRWLGRGRLPDVGPAMVVAMVLVVVVTPAAAALAVLTGADLIGRVVGAMVRYAPVNLAVSIALVAPLGVSAVFIGTLIGTLLVLPRYLSVLSETTQTRVIALLDELRVPAAMTAVLCVALVGIRLADVGIITTAFAVAGCGLVFGAAALRWVVPRQDLRRLLP